MRAWRGIEEFVSVAESGSFSAAAEALNVSSSHVSRAVSDLENQLQAPLFFRSTRQVTLTDTGRSLLPQCARLVLERDEIYAMAAGSGEPQGELRITCATSIGEYFVAPIVQRYASQYPRVLIHLDLTNRLVDLIAENYDIAIRTGHLEDSRLISQRIAARRLIVSASPSYLKVAGTPQVIDDLAEHSCLVGTQPTWHFKEGTEERIWNAKGRWRCNSGRAVLDATLAGMGLSQLPEYYVASDIRSGRLVSVLNDYRITAEPIWAVYPQRRHILPKVNKLVERLRVELQPALDAADLAS